MNSPRTPRGFPSPSVWWLVIRCVVLGTLAIILFLDVTLDLQPWLPQAEPHLHWTAVLMGILGLTLYLLHQRMRHKSSAGDAAAHHVKRGFLFALIIAEGFCTLALASYLLAGDLLFALLLGALGSLGSRPFLSR